MPHNRDVISDQAIDQGIGSSALVGQAIQRRDIEENRNISQAVAESRAILDAERRQKQSRVQAAAFAETGRRLDSALNRQTQGEQVVSFDPGTVGSPPTLLLAQRDPNNPSRLATRRVLTTDPEGLRILGRVGGDVSRFANLPEFGAIRFGTGESLPSIARVVGAAQARGVSDKLLRPLTQLAGQLQPGRGGGSKAPRFGGRSLGGTPLGLPSSDPIAAIREEQLQLQRVASGRKRTVAPISRGTQARFLSGAINRSSTLRGPNVSGRTAEEAIAHETLITATNRGRGLKEAIAQIDLLF